MTLVYTFVGLAIVFIIAETILTIGQPKPAPNATLIENEYHRPLWPLLLIVLVVIAYRILG